MGIMGSIRTFAAQSTDVAYGPEAAVSRTGGMQMSSEHCAKLWLSGTERTFIASAIVVIDAAAS
ncbi:MAG: hypothetical protein ABJL55_06730 [Roseibium sp.]